jgi:hypothetical protein
MPKRAFKIAALVLSHLAAFVLAAAWVAGSQAQAEFQAAMANPLYRLGVRGHEVPPEVAATFPPFERDLEAVSGTLTPPTPEVIRLIRYLRDAQLNRAAEVCTALAWPRCDPATLAEMQKAVEQ